MRKSGGRRSKKPVVGALGKVTPSGDNRSSFPCMSAMSRPYSARFSVAPMMDWTDRRCRAFHRILTRRARLYTEMVTADAVTFGPRERLIGFDADERPVALQLGGAEPAPRSGRAHRRGVRL